MGALNFNKNFHYTQIDNAQILQNGVVRCNFAGGSAGEGPLYHSLTRPG